MNNQDKFNELRKKYPDFIYEKYEILFDSENLNIKYYFNIDKLNDNLLEDIVKKFLRVCNLSNDKIKIHVGPCASYESINIKDMISGSLDRIGINNVKYDNRDTVTNDDLFSEIGNKKGNHLTGIYYKPDEKTLKLLRHHSKWY